MKLIKSILLASMVFILACQNKTADKNMKDDAILMEDAKVKSEKSDTTHSGHDADTLNDR